MCGIAGIYNFRSGSLVDRATIELMTRILSHRGPDAQGVYVDREVGLGHRRLSILDLNDRGSQPMHSTDGRYSIVYNGEVYNYLELRKDLEVNGHRFRTETDTEVVLALYEKEGVDCLKKLNGMFAVTIFDSADRMLFIARDRMGIKPLYYACTPDGFVFASEAKALLASHTVFAKVHLPSIDTYMRFGYVPGEQTLFEGIYKLLPGHWAKVTPKGLTISTYWDIPYAPNYVRSVEDTAEELRTLLLDAMRIHMRSDVPVGVFLSGGLDSSTTVALLHEAGCRDLNTFSVSYREGAQYDESHYAQLVANYFGTKHHSLYLDSTQFVQFIPQYVWYMDEPVTEAAAISLYFISKLLREHVTVALSGEGSDELFAGYDIYRYMIWIERFRKLPEWLRSYCLGPFLEGLGHSKLQKYLRLAEKPLDKRYKGVSLYEDGPFEGLYSKDYMNSFIGPEANDPLRIYYDRTITRDPLSRMLYVDLKTWLVDDLLIKADKMSMANSIELRVPFLDYRVVEFASTVPSWMKLYRGQVKWILKRAMRGRLPDTILDRKKMGFQTPLAIMFRRDMSEYLRDLLLSDKCLSRAYFVRGRIEQIIAEHVEKKRDHHKLLWQLVVLEEWHRHFIDAPLHV